MCAATSTGLPARAKLTKSVIWTSYRIECKPSPSFSPLEPIARTSHFTQICRHHLRYVPLIRGRALTKPSPPQDRVHLQLEQGHARRPQPRGNQAPLPQRLRQPAAAAAAHRRRRGRPGVPRPRGAPSSRGPAGSRGIPQPTQGDIARARADVARHARAMLHVAHAALCTDRSLSSAALVREVHAALTTSGSGRQPPREPPPPPAAAAASSRRRRIPTTASPFGPGGADSVAPRVARLVMNAFLLRYVGVTVDFGVTPEEREQNAGKHPAAFALERSLANLHGMVQTLRTHRRREEESTRSRCKDKHER